MIRNSGALALQDLSELEEQLCRIWVGRPRAKHVIAHNYTLVPYHIQHTKDYIQLHFLDRTVQSFRNSKV